MKFVPTPISLSQIEPADRELWVLNKTKSPHSGDVFLTVPRIRGSGLDDVSVIKSWAAQNLCEQVSVAQLIDSNEFRKMISYGNLVIISSEDAHKLNLNSGRDYAEENQRIMARRQRSIDGSALNSSPVTTNGEGVTSMDESTVDLKVRSLIAPIESGDPVDEAKLINTLRTMEDDDELGVDELRYIQKIAKAHGKKKLLKYANSVLTEMADDD